MWKDGETLPLETLHTGRYQPATGPGASATGRVEAVASQPDVDAADEADAGEQAVAVFAATCLEERAGAVTPVGEVYDAIETWAAARDVPTIERRWFTRRLDEYIEFARDRRWHEGATTRCYIGIEIAGSVEPDA